MFDWTSHLRETAQWLLMMAATQGWQEHAARRRDELLADAMYGLALREELSRLQREARQGAIT